MNSILYVTSEVSPFAVTGGLGDVMGALPMTIKKEYDSDVRVVCPCYRVVKEKYYSKLKLIQIFNVKVGWRNQYCGIYALESNDVIYYFVDNEYYFNRDTLYGQFDDGERFAFFSKAVLEMIDKIKFYPDILHCNDWQTAYASVLLKYNYNYGKYKDIKSVFTIHNIQYQGIFDNSTLGNIFDVNEAAYPMMDFNYSVNLLKGAVECADYVTTVSKKYSEEIKTDAYSYGLTNILRNNDYKLTGIVNGIDYDINNPETDKLISYNFSSDNLEGKKKNKTEMLKSFGLKNPKRPLVSMITRLVEPKGINIVKDVIEGFIKDDINFVLLGTGDREYEDYFRSLNDKYPDHCKCIISFDKVLAQKIYASSDMFLMPSQSEACGIAQMIASRYGTLPIVHAVGGLYDTIKSCIDNPEGNGFTFADFTSDALKECLKSSILCYNNQVLWNKLIVKVMNVDFSWGNSAKKYMELYNNLK